MVSRAQRWAVTGLLAVCTLAAAGLALTGVMSYRAAHRAARDVLHSRAVEVAASFVSTARIMGDLEDPQRLQQLAREMATDQIGIAVVDPQGKQAVAAGAGSTSAQQLPPLGILRELRLQGQTHRMVRTSSGEEVLEHWRHMLTFPRRMGRPGMKRRMRWMRQMEQKGWGPPGWWSHKKGADEQWWHKKHQHKAHKHRPRLLRVTVSMSVAESLTAPAKTTIVMASVVSLVLLALGVLMHRAARRAQLAEQELQRQQALSALGEMAAVLAHEIRTPLGSIKGNAQLLGEERPDDERIQSMVKEAGRLERLVNGLLDYARPAEPRREATDPDQLASRAAQIVASRAAAASVNLVRDPAGCGACLRVDPDQILQVLVNLLQNAIEASTDRGTPVVIGVQRQRGKVSFSIRDSGPGFQGVDLEQILRPFYSTKERGTGLGLSVARRIVQQHGGELMLESRREGGAQVWVTLPERG
jgi:signal transduction histidine kinase